jgi:hypothetical protein
MSEILSIQETPTTPDEEQAGLHPLVPRFLAGEWVRKFCGSGDPADETNWIHVEWQGSRPYGKPVIWWGFGSAMTDERIVLSILQRPEEWEVASQNAESIRPESKPTNLEQERGKGLAETPCSQFVAESDDVYWGRVADKAIAEGRDIPHHWVIVYDDGADGCMPAGWYARGMQSNGMTIDWPVCHEYGPFLTEDEARAHAGEVDATYASAPQNRAEAERDVSIAIGGERRGEERREGRRPTTRKIYETRKQHRGGQQF